MVTACSISAEELLRLSPDLFALLLLQRLLQLEDLRNKAENQQIDSPRGVPQVRHRRRWRGTTRRLGIPTVHGLGFLPLLRPSYGPGRHSVSTQATEKASMASRAAKH